MSAIGNGSIFNAIPKAKVALSSLDPIFASEDDQRKKERKKDGLEIDLNDLYH